MEVRDHDALSPLPVRASRGLRERSRTCSLFSLPSTNRSFSESIAQSAAPIATHTHTHTHFVIRFGWRRRDGDDGGALMILSSERAWARAGV